MTSNLGLHCCPALDIVLGILQDILSPAPTCLGHLVLLIGRILSTKYTSVSLFNIMVSCDFLARLALRGVGLDNILHKVV